MPQAVAPVKGFEESNLLAALMDHLPDCIYFKDRDSRFVAVNRALAEKHGLRNPQEMIGLTDGDFFTVEHANAAMEDEHEIIRTGCPLVNLEEKETWPDGSATWASSTKLPFRDSEGNVIGTFGLSREVTEKKRAEDQLAKFAAELRSKNEALEEELAMARELQYTMLPQRYPRFRDASGEKSLNFHHFYQPSAAVSGDFFDIFKISKDIAGIFICDVMGHGVRAALVAATMRALVEEFRAKWCDPAEFLAEVNRALRRSLRHARTPLFSSAFYLVADLAKGEFRYANAGHPRPLRLNSEGVSALDCSPGSVLGLFDEVAFEASSCKLAPHDKILLFTDGLYEVEGADDQVYDYSRLLKAAENHRTLPMKELCRDLVQEVQQFSASKEFSDDVCLIGVEVEHLSTDA
ncbi:MAG: SpoIIE family protein phosphatase [Verrucomicrobiota bacterium]